MKTIQFSRSAKKTLERMPQNTASRILEKVKAYAVDPQSMTNNVKALTNSDAIRLRVGDWRVIMIDGVVLEVVKIAPRGGAY